MYPVKSAQPPAPLSGGRFCHVVSRRRLLQLSCHRPSSPVFPPCPLCVFPSCSSVFPLCSSVFPGTVSCDGGADVGLPLPIPSVFTRGRFGRHYTSPGAGRWQRKPLPPGRRRGGRLAPIITPPPPAAQSYPCPNHFSGPDAAPTHLVSCEHGLVTDAPGHEKKNAVKKSSRFSLPE